MVHNESIKTVVSFSIILLILTLINIPKLKFSSQLLSQFPSEKLQLDNLYSKLETFKKNINSPRNIEITLESMFVQEPEQIIRSIVTEDSNITATPIPTQSIPKIEMSKVLIIGDSRIQSELGIELESAINNEYKPEMLYRQGIPKSGLSRPDYYNWPENFSSLLKTYDPKTIIVMFGANDAQRIYVDNQKVDMDVDAVKWNTEYSKRVREFTRQATNENRCIIWIGNQISGLPYYSTLMEKVNKLTEQSVDETKCSFFLDTWSTLADKDGNYTNDLEIDGKKVTVRTKDKIHLTRAGGEIIAKQLVDFIDEYNKKVETTE